MNGMDLRILAALFLVSFLACSPTPVPVAEDSSSSADWTAYGAGVTLNERTAIADILAAPEEFKDRMVAVQGRIVGVCTMMGCWVDLESDSGERLRIKVDDGDIVFPQEAQGLDAVAQGKVEVLDYTREEFIEKARHEAEEMGQEFDESSVGEPPYREVRIFGSGALIAPAPKAD